MIITGFDSRNLTIVIDALQMKLLMAVLCVCDKDIYESASKLLEAEGFEFTPEDLYHTVAHADVLLRPTMSRVKPLSGMGDEPPEDGKRKLIGSACNKPKKEMVN